MTALELLKMWRGLVSEGGVPRYTITSGAALNTLVTWTDGFLASAMSAGTAETPQEAQGEARQRGPAKRETPR